MHDRTSKSAVMQWAQWGELGFTTDKVSEFQGAAASLLARGMPVSLISARPMGIGSIRSSVIVEADSWPMTEKQKIGNVDLAIPLFFFHISS